ncbi:hypothetical protein EV363DRAFT_1300962 [Boletus edulis]|nr:hypothetical protein EV363DRAFT_1300962 [Boletus edulis]
MSLLPLPFLLQLLLLFSCLFLSQAASMASGDFFIPFTDDTSAGPPPIPVELNHQQKKKVIAKARAEVVHWMFLGQTVSNQTECKALVQLAVAHDVQSVVGGVITNSPTNAEQEVRIANFLLCKEGKAIVVRLTLSIPKSGWRMWRYRVVDYLSYWSLETF